MIELRDVHVSYGTFKALCGIDIKINRGEIHGLVGDHGAGKSTLVKLLCGAVSKESGTILFNDKIVESLSPRIAIKNGIGIVHQEQNVIPTINAVENIFSGQSIVNYFGFVKTREMKNKAEILFSSLGIDINLEIPLSCLSRQEQLMVEIAKALSIDPEILILDEISSRLTPIEMEKIYKLLFEFKKKGRTIIYISHNMDEIFRFADRVTIIQNGYRKGTEDIKDLDKVKLIKMTYSSILSREELEKDNMELYLLKKYNENIINNLPIGVIILDRKKEISLTNKSTLDLLNLTTIEVLGKNIETILNKNIKDNIDDIIKILSDRTYKEWDDLAWREDKIVSIKIFPLNDNEHKFIGSILLLEDVSQDRIFNDYLLRTEKIASIAELAAGVAHEINTPLSVINIYIDLLKEKIVDEYSIKKIHKIEKELNMITNIISSLLSFSKIKQFPMKTFDISDLINDVILLLHHKLIQKNINLVWNQGVGFSVFGDENQIKQVLINLLKNSIEAVLNGGFISVTLSTNQNSWVEVSIIDDGYGIPDDVINKIYDPFFSTKSGQHNTGLGLSICHHIIESHHGIMTCSSGKKTKMGIRLPIHGV